MNPQDISTFEEVMRPYKDQIKSQDNGEDKLTSQQHRFARLYGFKDWQKFQYRMKEIHAAIPTLDFSKGEWCMLFDGMNGTIVFMEQCTASFLRSTIFEIDKYMSGGSQWLNGMSDWDGDDEDTYKPSASVLGFAKKVDDLTEIQVLAVFLKVLIFWKQTFWISDPVNACSTV